MKRKLIPLSIFCLIFISSLSMNTQSNLLNSSAETVYDPWNFIALGDTRNWAENTTSVLRQTIYEDVMLSNPNMEFILHTGDMVNDGGEQDDWDRYYEDIDLLVQNNVTFYYSVGNHETYTYKLPDGSYGPPELNFSTYMSNVEMPGNERFYSFDNKGIHFIIINTEEFYTYEFEITTEQEEWIIADLQSNTMNFTIAMMHRPMYSIKDASRVAHAANIRAVLEPIFIEYGIDLVFSGHDHNYYNTIREGIQHIGTSGGGAPLYVPQATNQAIDGDVYISEYHYCNISVTEDTLTIEALFYDANLETTTIEDTVIMYLIEPPTTETSFYFGFILLLIWVIPLIRRKNNH